jgi:hypothetical protein
VSETVCTHDLAEHLMLELSAGVSLEEAARVLGIQGDDALHIIRQPAMEIRLTNLERAWADALLKMPGNFDADLAPDGDNSNVVPFPVRERA